MKKVYVLTKTVVNENPYSEILGISEKIELLHPLYKQAERELINSGLYKDLEESYGLFTRYVEDLEDKYEWYDLHITTHELIED